MTPGPTTPEAVRVNFSPGVDVAQNSVLVSEGLMGDPEREHLKPQSSGLYPAGDWQVPAEGTVEVGQGLIRPEEGMQIFGVPDDVFSAVLADLDPFAEGAKIGASPFEVSGPLREAATELVVANLGNDYALDPEAVLLRSNPATGMNVGQTTDGLHFDIGDPDTLRLGVNLGGVARRAHWVPESRDDIMDRLGNDADNRKVVVDKDAYAQIAELPLDAHAALVNPGEGWTLPTIDFLHDGRRDVPTGFSSFVLFSATRI